jgi:hypothetical protein
MIAQEPAQPESFEWEHVDEPTFLRALGEATHALDGEGIGYALIGGIASASHGRPRWTHDIDVLVLPADARRALHALAGAGFRTQETDQSWLYKGLKEGVLVDVIFRLRGDIYLDDEMLRRVERREFQGLELPMLAAEDLLVIKAVTHDEQSPRHWHDALAIVASAELDWDYLLLRARHGPRRVLSLLLYAQSNDLLVPAEVTRSLFEQIYRSEAG